MVSKHWNPWEWMSCWCHYACFDLITQSVQTQICGCDLVCKLNSSFSAWQAVDHQHPAEPAQVRQPLCGWLLLHHVPGKWPPLSNTITQIRFDIWHSSRLERRGRVRWGRRQGGNFCSMTAWRNLDPTFLLRCWKFPHFNTWSIRLSWNEPSYMSFQFENSLGKLQVVTVKAPRQIIDVGVVSFFVISQSWHL